MDRREDSVSCLQMDSKCAKSIFLSFQKNVLVWIWEYSKKQELLSVFPRAWNLRLWGILFYDIGILSQYSIGIVMDNFRSYEVPKDEESSHVIIPK